MSGKKGCKRSPEPAWSALVEKDSVQCGQAFENHLKQTPSLRLQLSKGEHLIVIVLTSVKVLICSDRKSVV